MAKGESPAVHRDIHTLFHVGTSNGLTDGQLLDCFRARSDLRSSEAAFAGLMARHGPMVLGVCRRALRNPDDVADAFQATFLILVRKADTVRVEDSLGRWLYGVSRRVSVRAKLAAARRSAREVREIEIAAAPAAAADLSELRDVLDEEIGRLPEKFRSAVVLCELEGCGHDEAARQLGCAVGTVKSRLSRAREKLRSRLIRRGVAPTAWALYVESTSAAVPAGLILTTVKAAIGYADGIVSPALAFLIRGVLRAMLLKKVSMIAITVVASLAMATSAGVWARQAATRPPRDQPDALRAQKQIPVENASAHTGRSTTNDPFDSTEMEDGSIDRIELLRLDIDLLEAEIQAWSARIERTNSLLIENQLSGENEARRSELGSLRQKLRDDRKVYLLKKKELNQKQLEKDEMEMKQIQANHRRSELEAKERARIAKEAAREAIPASVPPAASVAARISPVLEKRLSEIEGKLDDVLNAIKDLKREMRR